MLSQLFTSRPIASTAVCRGRDLPGATFFHQRHALRREPVRALASRRSTGPGDEPAAAKHRHGLHPPMLYLATSRSRSVRVPIAGAPHAENSTRSGSLRVRKWTLVSWLFLSIGLLLGMWWRMWSSAGRLLGMGSRRERALLPWLS